MEHITHTDYIIQAAYLEGKTKGWKSVRLESSFKNPYVSNLKEIWAAGYQDGINEANAEKEKN